MNEVHLIHVFLAGTRAIFFSIVSPQGEDRANALAGDIIDRLADNSGLTFDYQVTAVPYMGSHTTTPRVLDAAWEALQAAMPELK
jgi:hypothetical protein